MVSRPSTSSALDSLWLGVHALEEQVDNFASGVITARTDVKLYGGFFHWTPGDWELMGEYYGFDNRAMKKTRTSITAKLRHIQSLIWFDCFLSSAIRLT